MRAVVQRVTSATVRVGEKVVGEIGPGLAVLVGVGASDTLGDATTVADKLVGLRVFGDDSGAMNRSVAEVAGEVLVISQFTLYGDVRRGRRPSFTAAAAPDDAAPLVEALVERLRHREVAVSTGRFGAMMTVELTNDGPVTIILETAGGKLV